MNFWLKKCALIALFLASASAWPGGFIDGFALQKWSLAFVRSMEKANIQPNDGADAAAYMAYIMGAHDMVEADFGFCTPARFRVEQGAYVVAKYLKDHPEHLNRPGSMLVTKALLDAFPCKK